MSQPPPRTGRFQYSALVPVLCLFVVYILSRLHHVLAMPPFIDEFLHIQWAQDVYSGHFLTGAANGRLLALWWMALFQLSGDGLLWTTRTVTLLFGLIAVAAVYNLGQVLASRCAGLLAAVFYILAPFTFFHDRLGLSDAYVSTLGILALWFSVRYARQGRDLDAILAGLSLTTAITVKATGLMLIALPVLALFLLIPWARWKRIVRGSVLCYAAFGLTWGPFYLFMRSRGWSYFGVAVSVVGTDKISGVLERFAANVATAWMLDTGYLSLAVPVLFAVLAVYLIIRHRRVGLLLMLGTLLPLVMILAFATKVSGRYILLHIPVLILGLAIGLAVLASDLRQRGGWLGTLAVPLTVAIPLVWGILFAVPYQIQMMGNPASVMLPGDDQMEYIEGDSSGFALDTAANYLLTVASQRTMPLRVVGLLANCGGLGLELPTHGRVTLECPPINFDGSQQQALAALVNRRASEAASFDLWMVSENSPYISLDGITAPYDKVITFDRPGGLVHVSLYHVDKAGS
ncbi:MAG TPA: glycosyltransferase family 39 protein [Aggregatilineaceae bacterium]|nr:glycosyltransferase family 39 protein [Aggregatilineaceae bacterium]